MAYANLKMNANKMANYHVVGRNDCAGANHVRPRNFSIFFLCNNLNKNEQDTKTKTQKQSEQFGNMLIRSLAEVHTASIFQESTWVVW